MKDTGGAAFGHGAENGHCCGATLRDYFAAKAMQGMIGDRESLAGTVKGWTPENIAIWSYKQRRRQAILEKIV